MAFFDRFKKKEQPQKSQSSPEFDKSFASLRTDMLTAGNQFAQGDEDRLYILCAGQNDVEWFYQLRGKIRTKDELNADGVGQYDVSDAAVQQCRNKLADDWQKILQLFSDYHKEIPKGCRMIYDNRSGKFHGKFALDDDMDVSAEALKWITEEKQKLAEAGEQPVYNWKEAYRANVRYFEKDGEVIGVYALGEGVDTVLPVYPRAAYEGKEIMKWELSLVTTTDYSVIAKVNYRIAIKVLPEITGTQVVDDVMLVQGLSLEQMKQLADQCSSMS